MWLFTTFGFFSLIQHRDDPELLLVRARVKGDLELLKKKYLPNLGEIVYMPTADYPHRALAWKVEVAEAAKLAFLDINYTNFKSAVSKEQGSARHDLYMRVWSVMKNAERDMREGISRVWDRARSSKGWYTKDGKVHQMGFFDDKKDDPIDFAKSRKAREERLKDIHKGKKGKDDKEPHQEETLQEAQAFAYATDTLDQYWCPNCRLFGGHYKGCTYRLGGKK